MSHTREHTPERRTIRQHIVSCIVSIVILATGVGIFVHHTFGGGEEPPPEDDADGTTTVTTVAVQSFSKTGKLDIEVDGIVTPSREVEVATEVGGKIALKGPFVLATDVDSKSPVSVVPDVAAERSVLVEKELVKMAPAFRAGDFVEANTVLIVIDQQDYTLVQQRNEQQLAQARAELKGFEAENDEDDVTRLVENAREEWRLNQEEFDLMKNSPRLDAFSKSELNQAQKAIYASVQATQSLENQLNSLSSRRERLEVAVNLAAIELEKASNDLTRTIITAPCSGVIVQDFVEAGSYIQKGTPLFVIEDTSSVEVRCNLKMEDLYWLWHQEAEPSSAGSGLQTAYEIPRAEATVSYQMTGRSDLEYTWRGRLERYDGIGLDERTRTVPCRVVVDNPREVAVVNRKAKNLASERVRPPALVRGMYVTVQIHVKPDITLVKIPEAAVQTGKWVWRFKDKVLERIENLPLIRYMEDGNAGKPDDGESSLSGYWLVPAAESGIEAGDRLVIAPMAGLGDAKQLVEDRLEDL